MTHSEQQLQSHFHMKVRKLLLWAIIIGAVIPGTGFYALFFFFLYTSFPFLKQMFMWMAIFMVITLIFPPLGMIIWIVVIIFLLMRIKFIKDHWFAIKKGLLLYTVLTILFSVLSASYILFPLLGWFNILVSFVVGIVVSKIAVKIFDAQLEQLYRLGYTTKSALGIMGSAPLLLITLLLPFLKMAIPADFVFSEATEVKMGTTEPIVPKTATAMSQTSTEPIITEPVVPTTSTTNDVNPLKFVKVKSTVNEYGDTKTHVKVNSKGVTKTAVKLGSDLLQHQVQTTHTTEQVYSEPVYNELGETEKMAVTAVKSSHIGSQEMIDKMLADIEKQSNNK